MNNIIRFPQTAFASLRNAMLADSSREQFAMLIARRETAPDGREVFVALEGVMAQKDDLLAASLYNVRPSREFVAGMIAKMQKNMQANAIIDVHTHPFSKDAHFSGVDDADETRFSKWLHTMFGDTIHYASVLLSGKAANARVWHNGRKVQAIVRTQTFRESVPHIVHSVKHQNASEEMQARTELALGVDVIRAISREERIVLAGVGGIGSVLAEQLVRSGFTRIGLIDADVLELTNLNRFAGGFRDNLGQPKVEVAATHLRRINPDVDIVSVQDGVESPAAQSLMAEAGWIIVSTDSHSSRQCVQKTAIKYAVPLISAGVSITVAREGDGHRIVDQSGEVIVARYGDGICLHCLRRINPYKVAAETNPDPKVREGLVSKGYVQGVAEKEPAVMPLNAVIASMTVQTLIDQYREDAVHHPVMVYESHAGSCMYPDTQSLDNMLDACPVCGRDIGQSPKPFLAAPQSA